MLSALDLSCSDQLYALSERAERKSDGVLAVCVLLACDVLAPLVVATEGAAPAVDGVRGVAPEVRLPFVPGLVGLGRRPRMACAPKLR